MIQLANDPNAGRSGTSRYHGHSEPLPAQGRRGGHAWPFPSRYAAKPEAQDRPVDKSIEGDSGS